MRSGSGVGLMVDIEVGLTKVTSDDMQPVEAVPEVVTSVRVPKVSRVCIQLVARFIGVTSLVWVQQLD